MTHAGTGGRRISGSACGAEHLLEFRQRDRPVSHQCPIGQTVDSETWIWTREFGPLQQQTTNFRCPPRRRAAAVGGRRLLVSPTWPSRVLASAPCLETGPR